MNIKSNIKKFFLNNKGFISLLILLFAFRSSILDWNLVPSGSMIPTIKIGDVVLVNKMAYNIRIPFTKIEIMKTSDFNRGEIIIFDSESQGKRMIKRLIGLPNDTVEMKNGKLFINNSEIEYSKISDDDLSLVLQENIGSYKYSINFNKDSESLEYSSFIAKIPEEHVLVLGDNRNNSADSRYFGYVHKSDIVGSSKRVLLSFNNEKYYIPRIDRFFFNYNKKEI